MLGELVLLKLFWLLSPKQSDFTDVRSADKVSGVNTDMAWLGTTVTTVGSQALKLPRLKTSALQGFSPTSGNPTH